MSIGKMRSNNDIFKNKWLLLLIDYKISFYLNRKNELIKYKKVGFKK